MRNWDFILLLQANIFEYICILIMIGLFYYFILKKHIKTIIDPYFLSFLGSMMGFSIVIFLFYLDKISTYYFMSYILTQSAFLFFFMKILNKKFKKIQIKFTIKKEMNFIFSIYIVTILLDVISQMIVYKYLGIPIFKESRLETFLGGNGIGILSRIIDISKIVALYCLFYFLLQEKKNKKVIVLSVFYIIYSIITFVLSGSKSAILNILYLYFAFSIINNFENKIARYNKYIYTFMFISVISVIVILNLKVNNVQIALFLFSDRFIYYGDIYWQSYPNQIIENIDKVNPIIALFTDFIGSFRLLSWKELPLPLGFQLNQKLMGIDVMSGANARHNVFGLVYFGFFKSLFFSGFLGVLLAFSKKILYVLSDNKNHIVKIFFVLIYLKLSTVETDPPYAFGGINSIIMIFPIIIVLGIFVNNLFFNRKDERSINNNC